jgi:hypothetical protein
VLVYPPWMREAAGSKCFAFVNTLMLPRQIQEW